MVRYCCARGCTNEWKPNQTIIFHRFPLKRPEILKLWIQAIQLKNFHLNANTVLCSDHFIAENYLESSLKKNLLKKDAVPSVFKFSQHLQKKTIDTRPRSPSPSASNAVMETNSGNLDMHEVGTQTSPKCLKKSACELKLNKKIELLQQKLKKREKRILYMRKLIDHLKQNKCSSDIAPKIT